MKFRIGKHRIGKYLIALCLVFLFAGCALVPFVDSFQKSGLTESSRKELLPKKVKAFYSDVSSNRFIDMSSFLHPDRKESLLAELRKNRKHEKVTEYEIDYVEFYDEANEAEVDMIVSYYRKPYYIVNERLEKQVWKFYGTASQWVLYKRFIDDTY